MVPIGQHQSTTGLFVRARLHFRIQQQTAALHRRLKLPMALLATNHFF